MFHNKSMFRVCYKGSSELCQIWLFDSCWLLVILMGVSLKKYGQLIIQLLSYTSMVCATKVLLEVPADLKILNIYLYTMDALAESAHFDYNTTFLRSHKISWDLTISTEVSQDLLRYHKIYWDLKYQLIWHSAFNFDTWHLTFDIDMLLTLICCDIWQLIFDIYAEFVWLHCCFSQNSNAS